MVLPCPNRLFLTDIRPRDKIPNSKHDQALMKKILVFFAAIQVFAACAQFEQSFDTHNSQPGAQFGQTFDTHDGQTSGGCQCACVNGRMQSMCANPSGPTLICSGSCPSAPTSIAPITPGVVSPVGTDRCSQQQVLNPKTGIYQWRTVCR